MHKAIKMLFLFVNHIYKIRLSYINSFASTFYVCVTMCDVIYEQPLPGLDDCWPLVAQILLLASAIIIPEKVYKTLKYILYMICM